MLCWFLQNWAVGSKPRSPFRAGSTGLVWAPWALWEMGSWHMREKTLLREKRWGAEGTAPWRCSRSHARATRYQKYDCNGHQQTRKCLLWEFEDFFFLRDQKSKILQHESGGENHGREKPRDLGVSSTVWRRAQAQVPCPAPGQPPGSKGHSEVGWQRDRFVFSGKRACLHLHVLPSAVVKNIYLMVNKQKIPNELF